MVQNKTMIDFVMKCHDLAENVGKNERSMKEAAFGTMLAVVKFLDGDSKETEYKLGVSGKEINPEVRQLHNTMICWLSEESSSQAEKQARTKAEEFVSDLQMIASYWANIAETAVEAAHGTMFSILTYFDGCSSINDFRTVKVIQAGEVINSENKELHAMYSYDRTMQ